MICSKETVLSGLLWFGLLPIFASVAADTHGGLLPSETLISHTTTADNSQSSESSLPGKLRWIRGTLLSWSADSITLQPIQPGKKSLTLELSRSKQIVHATKGTEKVISVDQLKDEELGRNNEESLAVGSAVQVHYFEQRKKFYATVIIEETSPIPASQKESGSSYLGVFEKIDVSPLRFGAGTLTFSWIVIRVDGRARRFSCSSRATVADGTGRRLTVRELKEGDTVLISYRLDGSGSDLGTPTTTLLEIRNLNPH
jgi:hypothetical protein